MGRQEALTGPQAEGGGNRLWSPPHLKQRLDRPIQWLPRVAGMRRLQERKGGSRRRESK